MLVDSDSARAERIARRLASLGLRVQLADNGALGLLRAHELLPSAIIAAADLPILDGLGMLEALRKRPTRQPIQFVLVCENASHEELARAWRAGVDLCASHANGDDELIATLQRALAPHLTMRRSDWAPDLGRAVGGGVI